MAEHAAALDRAARVLARELKLADGLVDEPHLLVGDAEVVVRLVVLGRELLLDALLELAEDLLEGHLALRRRDVGGLRDHGFVAELLLELLGKVEELLLVGEEALLVDGRSLGRRRHGLVAAPSASRRSSRSPSSP